MTRRGRRSRICRRNWPRFALLVDARSSYRAKALGIQAGGARRLRKNLIITLFFRFLQNTSIADIGSHRKSRQSSGVSVDEVNIIRICFVHPRFSRTFVENRSYFYQNSFFLNCDILPAASRGVNLPIRFPPVTAWNLWARKPISWPPRLCPVIWIFSGLIPMPF